MSPRTPTPASAPLVTAYVDGACHPNPGRGGWGVVLRSGAQEKRLSGVVPEDSTTNQRAEIFAAVQALTALLVPCKVRVYSDSQYLIQTMLGNYRRRTNLDLWELLDDAAASHAVQWSWVRGHSGDEAQELAHSLAEGALATDEEEEELEICEPREIFDPACGEAHTYYCGRLLSLHNVANKEERCPGGTMLCDDCLDDGAEFFRKAYNARAVDEEWGRA